MIKINNSYLKLPKEFYQVINPSTAKNPEVIVVNSELCSFLNIDGENENDFLNFFSGKKIIPNSIPIALVYAGHQFGHFVPELGDGRAILLGDVIGKDKRSYDIQLKGSGITKFSRNGDGKCPLGPALREYLVSESLFSLDIPTTRSLAVILTGEDVYRENKTPGAILVRVASSHLRVGTFEYFFAKKEKRNLKILLDFSIKKHFKEIKDLENDEKYLNFLSIVMNRHIDLVSKWLSYGFIHGVMNTDNTTISGETIDYGPCAFMNYFSRHKVFSSIDYQGRYSFFNQPKIALWNLTSLANCLTLLFKSAKNIKKLDNILSEFSDKFNMQLIKRFSNKLGIFEKSLFSETLIKDWLTILENYNLDFTNSFLKLEKFSSSIEFFKNFPSSELTKSFFNQWSKLLTEQKKFNIDIKNRTRLLNPQYIPRNHLIDEAIEHSINGDYTKFFKLNSILRDPFKFNKHNKIYQKIPSEDCKYKTFCGT